MSAFARFRDDSRDRLTDYDRFRRLDRLLNDALASIEAESRGLSRRLDEARMQACVAIGTDDGLDGQREAADETRLVEAEAQMMMASRRLSDLRRQHAACLGWIRDVRRDGIVQTSGEVGSDLETAWRWQKFTSAGRQAMRAMAWALLILVAYATLSGIAQRPALPWLSVDLERALAYVSVAGAFALGYPRRRLECLLLGIGAVVLLEWGQSFEPSRHASAHDVVVKSAGLVIGLGLAVLIERFGPRILGAALAPTGATSTGK